MIEITNTGALNMDNLAGLLGPLANQANYSNVTPVGFTATGNGIFASTIEVDGWFTFGGAGYPFTKTISGGLISKISYSGIDGDHVITLSEGVSYTAFVSALGNNDDLLKLLLSGWDKIDGSSGADVLHGGALGDTIHGGSGKDTIYGDDGDDHLYGDGHADHLYGGAGRDVLWGGKGVDILDGGANEDTVDYRDAKGSVVVRLDGANQASVKVDGVVVDKLLNIEGVWGGKHDDTLTGDKYNNTLSGNGGRDTLKGGSGDDELLGGDGRDVLIGGSGNDILDGGLGNDTLTGGKGADRFSFRDVAGPKPNIDTVTDFKVGEDFITLSQSGFHIGQPPYLTGASGFLAMGHARDADDRIIYKSGSGDLLYDADGNGAGKAVVFAHIGSGLALSEADFQLTL